MTFAFDPCPRSIPRVQVLEMIRALGLNPDRMVHMEFTLEGVYATMMAHRVDTGGLAILHEDVIKLKAFIPFTGEDDQKRSRSSSLSSSDEDQIQVDGVKA